MIVSSVMDDQLESNKVIDVKSLNCRCLLLDEMINIDCLQIQVQTETHSSFSFASTDVLKNNTLTGSILSNPKMV